ncbi:uncharacterized protein F4807DRAFT_329010 [Annulohypoxylon truncatum]|uniref:uncharacterized protein n=1 Tax=Annulohypoxylon truncatum TaxID=327061 RepID=UPI002007A04E|nr:uncharacterized protein F4807DRAFT_329010 [Annulohypoxylon truncatum]KAI1204537.1 hypothetical protein F4807DRAFT_329010 [Annulohypoxylon truncatum]
MKIIVTGSTGFVGGEVIRQAIADERITHVFALTRKPLAGDFAKNPKLTVVEHQDYSTYPPELLAQLAGAEACIWTLGGRAYQFPDVETARKVSVDYTLAAAKAFIDELAPKLPEPQKFRFLFCSGRGAEWDEKKNMRMFADTRRIKGQVEKGLCDLADANKERFETWSVRPGAIMKRHAGLVNILTANTSGFIGVDHLAKAMLTIVINGHKDRIIEAEELLKL